MEVEQTLNQWDEYDRICLNRWWDETNWLQHCSNCGMSMVFCQPCPCTTVKDAPELGFEMFNETLGG